LFSLGLGGGGEGGEGGGEEEGEEEVVVTGGMVEEEDAEEDEEEEGVEIGEEEGGEEEDEGGKDEEEEDEGEEAEDGALLSKPSPAFTNGVRNETSIREEEEEGERKYFRIERQNCFSRTYRVIPFHLFLSAFTQLQSPSLPTLLLDF